MTRPFRFAVQAYAPNSGAEWRSIARRTEELGFSALHLADHVIGAGPALGPTNHSVQTVAAIPAMAVAGEVTSRIKIGCRVLCIDYRNPIMLAKELATLDQFNDGRTEIGLGAGWLSAEYEAMGITFERAGTRLDKLEEVIQLLRASFGTGLVNIEGTHVHAVGYEAAPKSLQHPMPPLIIGGGSPRVLGIAGREADIVSLNFDNSSGKIGADGVGSSTAEMTAEKIGWIRNGAGARFDDIELEIGAYFTVVTANAEATAAVAERMSTAFGLNPDDLVAHPHALIGSVEEICDRLIERRERYGISYITFGSSTMEAVGPVVERLTGT